MSKIRRTYIMLIPIEDKRRRSPGVQRHSSSMSSMGLVVPQNRRCGRERGRRHYSWWRRFQSELAVEDGGNIEPMALLISFQISNTCSHHGQDPDPSRTSHDTGTLLPFIPYRPITFVLLSNPLPWTLFSFILFIVDYSSSRSLVCAQVPTLKYVVYNR